MKQLLVCMVVSFLMTACIPPKAPTVPSSKSSWHKDADGDGFGDSSIVINAVNKPDSTYVLDDTDCDDSDPSVNSLASEIPNDGIDQDCSGSDAYLGSCKAILALHPAYLTGIYKIDPDGDGGAEPFDVHCDMSTNGGGWIDVVRTFTLVSADATSVARFFNGANISVAVPISTGEFYFTYGFGSSNNDPVYLDHTILAGAAISEVSMSYVLQGNNSTGRCSNANWIPLNGPGFNGGFNGYFAVCPSGRNCIQGSPMQYRDLYISATYANDNLSSSDLLTWSGSSYDGFIGDTADNSCSKSASIPVWQSAIYFNTLLLR